MASATESIQRSPFTADHLSAGIHRSIPILPSSSSPTVNRTPDPMDLTPSNTMGPPQSSSPIADRNASSQHLNPDSEPTVNGNGGAAVGAAAAAQQPKVVQTAFIHKLYNMLEDQSIQHLISWSSSNESFVMSPSTEFSKVLSSYFKHTNISSFVRQLNMYGFHKVSDVFHTGAPDSPLWEFKHGNGNFKRGDLIGLREIKRRASRHALIHRDSFSTGPKGSVAPPEVPTEPMPNSMEARLSVLEHNYFDVHARLARSEDTTTYLHSKCQILSEGLMRCHQWNQDLATYLVTAVPDPENQIHKDVAMMQREIARQTDILRSIDELPAAPSYSGREQYFSTLNDTGPPLSPRQTPAPDRRPSQPSLLSEPRPPFRTPVAPHIAISPRRYGSIGSNSNNYSPSSARAPAHPPPPPPSISINSTPQHPLATVTVTSPPTNLPRRHTSADIRLHGWQGPGNPPTGNTGTAGPPPQQPNHSPYASGQNSTQWPSSPHRTPIGGPPTAGDEQLRNALAAYELPRATHGSSRQITPPLPPPAAATGGAYGSVAGDAPGAGAEPNWQLSVARFNFKGVDGSAPPTRRSSMASNVHSLLNPTAEGVEEGDVGPTGLGRAEEGGGKRKRVQ